MVFVNIVGPKNDIDYITNKYILKYNIQLENALSELSTTKRLIPFDDVNPYKKHFDRSRKFLPYIKDIKDIKNVDISYDDAIEFLRNTNHNYKELELQKKDLLVELDKCKEQLDQITKFKGLNFEINKLLGFKHIKYRFGRIPKDYYHKLEKYFFENEDVIFLEGDHDESYFYGIYFTSADHTNEIDAIFASMHFDRIILPNKYTGTPRQACEQLLTDIANIQDSIEKIEAQNSKYFADNASLIKASYDLISQLYSSFDIRKLAALTNKQASPFFILCGWMSSKDANSLAEEISAEENTNLIIEDDTEGLLSKPPTKLKNPKILKPFEMFIKMYGLPSYNEIDPTWFIALTYTFIFGIMFGDVGQGLCLTIFGYLIYFIKKTPLAAIIGTAGIFSTFFGFMFGSVFGFENIIKPIWIRPIKAMSKVKFVGSLNTIFVVTIAFGMLLVVVSMILHIVNAIKAGEKGNALFDSNGIAGLVFYGSIIISILLFAKGYKVPGTVFFIILLGIPILLILFKEPLENIINNKTKIIPTGIGMFLTQGFFEIFEMLLSYFSNTLSFVRIGAFAVSHAAMMEVVLMLAGYGNGHPNMIVIVLGNIFVCAMEGLIVGIQVLRLEYYEMFSRFYHGDGRDFKPYNNKYDI